MATKSREVVNKFSFVHFHRITGGTTADIPVTALDPIDLTDIETQVFPYYYGSGSQSNVALIDPITDGTIVNASGAGEILVPWSGAGVYLWIWLDDVVATKTNWEDPNNVLNKGSIGGAEDLFGTPIAKTVNSRTGKIYITQYLTDGRTLILY